MALLSFTSVTSIPEGVSTPGKGKKVEIISQTQSQLQKHISVSIYLNVHSVHIHTCPVHDVDGNAGCRAVSSASHSVNSDGVVSARLQIINCSSGLGAGYSELLRVTVTS